MQCCSTLHMLTVMLQAVKACRSLTTGWVSVGMSLSCLVWALYFLFRVRSVITEISLARGICCLCKTPAFTGAAVNMFRKVVTSWADRGDEGLVIPFWREKPHYETAVWVWWLFTPLIQSIDEVHLCFPNNEQTQWPVSPEQALDTRTVVSVCFSKSCS